MDKIRKYFILKRILSSIKEKGLFYSFRNYILNELITCRFFITRSFRKVLSFFFLAKKIRSDSKRLIFVYDTNVTPITFDIIGYLSQCELEIKNNNNVKVLFVVIMNKERELKPNLQRLGNSIFDYFEWRVNNLLIQCVNLFPSIDKYFVTDNFNDLNKIIEKKDTIYPYSYFHQLPRQPSSRGLRNSRKIDFPLIVVDKRILAYVKKDFDTISRKRKVILFSLTEDKIQYKSNTEHWLKFIKTIDKKKYCPILIADHSFDSYQLFSEFKDYFYHKAVWSIELRAAAYQNAYLNMSVGHGPMELCYYNNKVKYIVFLKSNSLEYQPNIERKLSGWDIGKDLRFANKYQKIIWKKDNFENISSEFKKFVTKVKKEYK